MKLLTTFLGLVCLTGLTTPRVALAQPPNEVRLEVSPPVFPAGSDADMKAEVTLSAVDQPLSVMIENLSASSGVALKVTPTVGVQRMTVCVRGKSLHDVAGRIVETLSHGVNGTNYYFWQADIQNGKKTYILTSAASAMQDYQENLAQPRKNAIQTLRDFRAIAQRTQEERKSYKSSLSPILYAHVDTNPYAQAVSVLTEPQFALFLKTGRMTLNASKIEVALKVYNDMAKTDMFAAAGLVKVPDGPYRPPVSQIHLQVFSMGDYSKRTDYSVDIGDPVLSEIYAFQLGGISTSGILLNVYQEETNHVGRLAETGEAQTVYDLNQILNKKVATFQQRNDLGYILSLLSQATGKSIYEEHFLRPGYLAFGQFGSSVPDWQNPKIMKGTLPQIVNSICRKWDFQAKQADNGDLVFWSRRWGRDKQNDISETTLEPWRRRFQQNGYFTEADYRDMVQKLSWAQTRITLPYAFNLEDAEAVDTFLQTWTRRRYLIHRIDSLLTPAERGAALSPNGLLLADMGARQTLLNELYFRSDQQIAGEKAGNNSIPGPTQRQILQSRLFFSKPNLEGFGTP